MLTHRTYREVPRWMFAAGSLAGMIGLVLADRPPAARAQVVTISAARPETVRPSADGTLVDGSIYGPFDGVPDDWDWTFDESSYEGAITLATESPASSLEHRVVWEYAFSSVPLDPPVAADLTFTIRGAPVFPMPDSDVFIYAYPADLAERPDDFAAEPAVYLGHVLVEPFQEPTEYTLDISEAVNDAMNGGNTLGIRFQINPDTPHTRNQAFIDALDEEPTTKPHITVRPIGIGPRDPSRDQATDGIPPAP